MRALPADGELSAYRHEGFWQPMDTLRDRGISCEDLWTRARRRGGRGRERRRPGFWRDRRVLLTGHTGFKGAWLSLWLQSLGARVDGLLGGRADAAFAA